MRRQRQRGVTLLEMLVVVIVIALIVSISAPSVTAGIDSVRLKTATTAVAAFLNAASTRAERREQPVEVVISPGDHSLKILSTQPGFEQTMTLPSGISVHALTGQPLDDLQSGVKLLFLPGGAVPGIALELTNQHGGRKVVRLDPMSGYPRVENGGASGGTNEN